MTVDVLKPHIDLLSQEYVLVQAWKKTASHIRYHNWYSDTLELDRAAVNLPRFLADLAEQLKAPAQWNNDPLRIVPAPKSQQWSVTADPLGHRRWEPVDRRKTEGKLRPLAHVSLKDQVASTAIMLCLADRVETIQGDPRDSLSNAAVSKRVISYGNRLFCDATDGALHHRWGSEKLYRAYYQDYRSFLDRPETIAKDVGIRSGGHRAVIVNSDLRQFYDRVSPELLAQKLDAIKEPDDDLDFYALAARLLNWTWNTQDSREIRGYAHQAGLSDFSRVALPQGLVGAGFFANVALLDFDRGLREVFSQEIEPGVYLEDVCRYVDDLRIVLTIDDRDKHLDEIEQLITKWLQGLLDRHAAGLELSKDKTKAAEYKGSKRVLLQQSRRMGRIQSAISGGFDAISGEEILDAIQGLVRTQQRYSEQQTEDQDWPFTPIPDVRDATVARFAAGRFRSTYRSLRPLLASPGHDQGVSQEDINENVSGRSHSARSQVELDAEAKAFALGLIRSWVEDPSNVRLLRIGLDLWPAMDVLQGVLDLLRPFTTKGGKRKAPHRVAWYCLAEVFRAGATETGFVEDEESLPKEIDIAAYRAVLREEAARVVSLPLSVLPWYLRQQALLFLAVSDPSQVPIIRVGSSSETRHYRDLIRYLRGEANGKKDADFATLAVLARRSFCGQEKAALLVKNGLNPRRLTLIAKHDPSFALEILSSTPGFTETLHPRLKCDLCLRQNSQDGGGASLAEMVLRSAQQGQLRNELTALTFASKFLTAWSATSGHEAVTPSDVMLKISNAASLISEVAEVEIVRSRIAVTDSMYLSPSWCPPAERWRFQLGYLLRFILTAREDFTKVVRPIGWKESAPIYKTCKSHWYQRLYGLFSGHSAFGDDWLPISDWLERLLFGLLSWPGCIGSEMGETVKSGIKATRRSIDDRIVELKRQQGLSSGVLMLRLPIQQPTRSPTTRPLRACVVQTVIPKDEDFTPGDLTLSSLEIRRRHRNHLSAALAAVVRMLDLRETHRRRENRLDWLILPELSVHPHDVNTHLIPFARAYKTIIVAGLVYEELFVGQPLVNSAIWVIPAWSAAHGLEVLVRRQGKFHLAPDEEKLNADVKLVQGFRPCQWLVGYDWSGCVDDQPLWLTASVCYDATDLGLATDLRCHSDVFAILALNKDVRTFDQMALALHYHMFQLVIVANNGAYGGSNAYAPYREAYLQQVFHLHGQPQASIAFLEIDDIKKFMQRKSAYDNQQVRSIGSPVSSRWKYPPAGLKPVS